jgi:penicillin-binding protein-related factor A (putative recombinase)
MYFALIMHTDEEEIVCLKKMKFIQIYGEFRRSHVNRKTLKIVWMYVAGLLVDITKGKRVPVTRL